MKYSIIFLLSLSWTIHSRDFHCAWTLHGIYNRYIKCLIKQFINKQLSREEKKKENSSKQIPPSPNKKIGIYMYDLKCSYLNKNFINGFIPFIQRICHFVLHFLLPIKILAAQWPREPGTCVLQHSAYTMYCTYQLTAAAVLCYLNPVP